MQGNNFINRDWDRTDKDDYILNVAPRLSQYSEAVPQYSTDGKLLGWKIQTRGE